MMTFYCSPYLNFVNIHSLLDVSNKKINIGDASLILNLLERKRKLSLEVPKFHLNRTLRYKKCYFENFSQIQLDEDCLSNGTNPTVNSIIRKINLFCLYPEYLVSLIRRTIS